MTDRAGLKRAPVGGPRIRARVVVIGAGVVGLAVAERLSRRTSDVVVLESESRPGLVTSSRNSQVLHSGLYYPPGSLKAALSVAGNESLPRWCQSHGVPFRRLGKLIVATSEAETPELERLHARAKSNGVMGVASLDGRAALALEPSVSAVAGLWVPTAGILDARALMDSLARAATERGVTLALRHRVTALDREPGGWALEVMAGEDRFRLHAEWVVNAGGLNADSIAALAGIDVEGAGYRQHWVKGRYARLKSRWAVKHLVYPVPPVGLSGLGVHLTLGLDGDTRLGPDVVALESRVEDYSVDEGCLGAFFEVARRYLPSLERDELMPDTAGIRPKLAPVGGPWRDFVIAEETSHGCPGLVSLIGIESPGLTCSLEIGARVAAFIT